MTKILSIAQFGGGLPRFCSDAGIRRFAEIEMEFRRIRKYFFESPLGGGAIGLDLRSQTIVLALTNLAEGHHGLSTKTEW